MASGNATLQSVGLGQQAQLIADPGDGGVIQLGDQSLAVCVVDLAGAETRDLSDGTHSGQIAIVINDSASTLTLGETGGVGTLEVTANLAALCVYRGGDVGSWSGVVLTAFTS